MNQAVLHPPLPLGSDSPFASEQECIGHIGAHAHHSSFAAGVPDQLRRDGILAHTATGIPLSSIASRCGAPRPDSVYQPGTALSESASGSSTSPSSNASSALAYSYSNFSPNVATAYSNHYPLATFPSSLGWGNSSMSTTRRMSGLPDGSTSMLPPTRSPGLGNSVSPSMSASVRDNYTTTASSQHRHANTISPRYSDVGRYHSQADTPRSVLPTTMTMNPYSTYQTSSYPGSVTSSESPPFNAQETYGTITSDGRNIVPTIDAKIEKGFFRAQDSTWTCYRRNYFSVNVSFTLDPWTPNARLYFDGGNNKSPEQIQSMAVSLAAAVDTSGGKTIELIQHTPKRDKGPQLPMKKELLAPTPPGRNQDHSGYGINSFHQTTTTTGPSLPLQTDGESSQYSPTTHANSNYQHAFERIQFKSATANNGKRRAQQQFYHLIVELWANVQHSRDQEPRWVKVAARTSAPVVVRGRSPSHYQNEGPHNTASRGSGSSGFGGPGQNGLGSRGGTAYSSYGNGLSGGGASAMSSGMYRGTNYSLDPSPIGSHSVSSASSLSGGPVEGLVSDHHMADDDDAKMLDAPHDYQYYPSPLYDSLPSKVEGTLPLPERSVKEEYSGPGAITSGWQVGACGRFQGLDSSRGFYPNAVHAHSGY